MRNLFFLLFLLNYHFTIAQDSLVVYENSKTMSLGSKNCYTINIPQANLKAAASGWKKYLKQQSNGSVSEKKGEYSLSKSIITDISNDSIIVYTIFKDNLDSIQLDIFVSSKDSIFYSTTLSPETSTRIKTYIRNYAVGQYKNAVADELELEQEKLKELEKGLETLEEDNESFEKEIKANIRDNDRTENDINSNLDETKASSNAVSKQKQLLATYTEDSDLKKSEEKKLKELEKNKKKLLNENESLHEDIEDRESDNKKLQKKIDLNTDETIPAKKTEIEKQKHVIMAVDAKLKGIR